MQSTKLTTAQYRNAAKQLLGLELCLGVNLTGAIFLCFLMTKLSLNYLDIPIIGLVSLNVLLLFTFIQYCSMPLWGRLKLHQMEKEYGKKTVVSFVDWLDRDDDSTFEFK